MEISHHLITSFIIALFDCRTFVNSFPASRVIHCSSIIPGYDIRRTFCCLVRNPCIVHVSVASVSRLLLFRVGKNPVITFLCFFSLKQPIRILPDRVFRKGGLNPKIIGILFPAHSPESVCERRHKDSYLPISISPVYSYFRPVD